MLHIPLGTLAHVLDFCLGAHIRLSQRLLHLGQLGIRLSQLLFRGGLCLLSVGVCSSLLLFHRFQLRLGALLFFFLLTHYSLHIPERGLNSGKPAKIWELSGGIQGGGRQLAVDSGQLTASRDTPVSF